MKKLAQQILEIAALPISYKTRLFFYGVSSVKEARAIFHFGKIPLQQTPKRPKAHSHIPGRSYLSANLLRAAKFADCPLGSRWPKSQIKTLGQYGYIFVVGPEELTDIYPNETEVGQFVQRIYDMQYKGGDGQRTPEAMSFLTHVWGVLDREDQKSIIYDEENAAPAIGKKVLDGLPPQFMLWMLNHEVNLSNEGELDFKACYKIDRTKLASFNTTGKDFFAKAEKVSGIEGVQ